MIVLLLDQLTKAIIVEARIFRLTLIPGFLWLEKASNSGIAFGMLSSYSNQVTIIDVVVIVFLAIFYRRFSTTQKVAIGMIIGGALGNLVDRIRFGRVVDFIRMRYYPAIFNIADTFIVIGGILIAITYLWGDRFDSESYREGERMEIGQISPRKASKLDIEIDDPESYKGWQGVGGWLEQEAKLQGQDWRNSGN